MTELEKRTRVLKLAQAMSQHMGNRLEPAFWDILQFAQSETLLVALEHTPPKRDLTRWLDRASEIAKLLEPPSPAPKPAKVGVTRRRKPS